MPGTLQSWSDRKASRSQGSLFLSHAALPKSEGHPFYTKLNEVLACIDFDRQVEAKCEPFYADGEPHWGRISNND